MIFCYQHFVSNCSALAKPLFALTAGQKRRGKVRGSIKSGTYRQLTPSGWTPECDVALANMKDSLLHSVVLAHPDFSQPFILSIEASLDGLGTVLSQVPVGEEKAHPDLPRQVKSLCDSKTIKAQLDSHEQCNMPAELRVLQVMPSFQAIAQISNLELLAFTLEELQSSQESDPFISKIIMFLNQKRRPSRRERARMDLQSLDLCNHWHRLTIQDGVMYRVRKESLNGQKRYQFVVPLRLQEKRFCLECMILLVTKGKSGLCTLQDTDLFFFWPRMEHDMRKPVKHC